eukprot:TRINITY_DN22980_c0_g1_i2.p2 TRINITY_DN22980_c0_g1~~TRINITY_DN22980_c0_g1_i2.p2  ORF type:complete len:134 (+),score=16.37 TRINITY_DN22980_c0_g1_i2:166-567(+)
MCIRDRYQRRVHGVILDVHCGLLYLKYINEFQTLFKGIFNVDPHMSVVPQWLINFAMKKVIFMLLGIIQEKCRGFPGSIYEERVKTDTHLYDEIRKRLNCPPSHQQKSSQYTCLLYTSPSPRDLSTSRMPSSA